MVAGVIKMSFHINICMRKTHYHTVKQLIILAILLVLVNIGLSVLPKLVDIRLRYIRIPTPSNQQFTILLTQA